MFKTPYTRFYGVVLAALYLYLSPAAGDFAPFDLGPDLVRTRSRLETMRNDPGLKRNEVAGNLRDLRTSTQKAVQECRKKNPELPQTKSYLQDMVERLIWNSDLAQELKTTRGACVTVTNNSGGMFGSMFDLPRVKDGVISIPANFILKLKNEEELAFTLAHEAAHLLLQHEVYYGYMGTIDDKIAARLEREADEFGMHLLVNSGYDLNMALPTLIEMRGNDPMHAQGKELIAMRARVFKQLKDREIPYYAQRRRSYLTPEVMSELKATQNSKMSSLN